MYENELENENNYNTINIMDVVKTLWKYKYIIILFVVIAAGFTFVKTRYFTPDTYTSSGIIYVGNNRRVDENHIKQLDMNDIYTARLLSNTYTEMFKIRSFLEKVSTETGNKYSASQIKGMMGVSAINETELISVRITSEDPEDSCEIANAVLTIAFDKFSEITEGAIISILDKAIVPENPNNKNIVGKMMVSAIIGFILACIIIFIMNLFDNKVHNSDDIVKRYEIPVLGILGN